ncbi:hypothetical protein ACWATR_02765 [Nostoc sp. UIC 10890]
MQIVDLPYLESVPKDDLILGSAGVSVTSEAFAFGSTSYLFVSANSSATSASDGDFTENATGVAGAFGDNAIATVTVAVDGDPVIEKTSSNLLQNTAVESGFVAVISLPSKLTFYDLWKNLF